MLYQHLDLTTALRPSLLPDETLLFVQDAVGLYEGKVKFPNLQNGHIYLTSHRVCFVDNTDSRQNAIAIQLKNVDRYEYYAGFFKSSPKVTLFPKPARSSLLQPNLRATDPIRSSAQSPDRVPFQPPDGARSHRTSSSLTRPNGQSSGTWVCPICSFSNPVPSSFDPATASSNMALPACLACGIKPPFGLILKAAIASASGRQPLSSASLIPSKPPLKSGGVHEGALAENSGNDETGQVLWNGAGVQCSRCTFLNHPSLPSCELCGAPLGQHGSGSHLNHEDRMDRVHPHEPNFGGSLSTLGGDQDSIKISFRDGGEKAFYEKLKWAMVQRKWLLQSAPPIPETTHLPITDTQSGLSPGNSNCRVPPDRAQSAGIAGLERRGLDIRKKNEAVIGSAFEDMDALMASAKEIIALAESFAQKNANGSPADANQIIAESAKSLDMVTTKDMLGQSSSGDSLYLAELSRNLAEYLTDDAKGILRKEGGIMSLVDLWAVFNRSRGGVELISPSDFGKAARLWEKLQLPIRLRQFRNKLLVVQQADRTDDKTIAQLLSWLQELHVSSTFPPDKEFGTYISAQGAAQRFGWSVGVASEELEMAEEKGALCRDESIEGLRFWANWLVDYNETDEDDDIVVDGRHFRQDDDLDDVVTNLKATGLL